MPRNLFYASQISKSRLSAILTCKGGELCIIGGQIRIDMKMVLNFEMFAHHSSDKDEKMLVCAALLVVEQERM